MLSKVVRYKINIEKCMAFLYHSSKQLENKIIKVTIYITTKNIKSVMARITASQRCPWPNSQTLWVCWVIWQRVIMGTDKFKAANRLTLNRDIILDCPGWPNILTRIDLKLVSENFMELVSCNHSQQLQWNQVTKQYKKITEKQHVFGN